MHAGQLKASLPCAPSLPSAADGSEASPPSPSNKEHALGERRRMALPGASVMSVARPTSVRHCAVTVKSMHGAFVLVVVGSQMCAVAHPGTHAPRGRRCCAGVTPGFQESCCCVQPINSGFRLRMQTLEARGYSDPSFSATLCEKDNPERKPPARVSCARVRILMRA